MMSCIREYTVCRLIWGIGQPEPASCDIPLKLRTSQTYHLESKFQPLVMKSEEGHELDRGKTVHRHELSAATQARILPTMSARPTDHLVLRLPQRSQQPSTPTPLPNSNPSSTPSRQVPTPSSKNSTLSNPVHLPARVSPPWPWNPAETQLIRAGYQPAFEPPAPAASPLESEAPTSKKRARKTKPVMAEPRARAARHKGQMNFSSERKHCLPKKSPISRKTYS